MWAFTSGFGLTDGVVVGGLASGALLGLVFGAITYRSERPYKSALTLTQLFWFTIGLAVSTGITAAAGFVALLFRTEPGMIGYGPSPADVVINIITGVCIVAAGWGLAWLSRHYKSPRGIAFGLFIGAGLLGILYALSH